MASWARQRQQITEAADGGARARTGADGAVVLNLRRGPGAYALLSRRGRAADPGGPALLLPPGPAAPQQGLRLQPAPHPQGAQRLHPAAQRAEEARALCAGRRAPADQAGQGLLPRQVRRVPGPRAGDHPWQAAQRAERGRGLRAQGLAAGERARAAPSCSSRTRPTSSTLRGTGWSAPRARTTGTPGPRWRRSCASA